MKINSTKQHYVPQFYLRGFSAGKNQLDVYRMSDDKSYISAINDCCCQRDFYNMQIELIESLIHKNILHEDLIDELIRVDIEEICAPDIKNFCEALNIIITSKDIGFYLDNNLIDIIFNFMIIQYVRTPKFRLNFLPLVDSIFQLLPIEVDKVLTHKELIKIEHGKFMLQLFQNQFESNSYFDLSPINNIFVNGGRLFLFNQTEKSFLTSDNPVNIVFSIYDSSKIILIYFPLSANTAFILFDKEVFVSAKFYDRKVLPICDTNISVLENLNLLVVDKAHETVLGNNIDLPYLKSFINHEINLKICLFPPDQL